MHLTKRRYLLLATAGLGLATGVQAQSQAPAATGGSASHGDEIIVTGQKRAENVQQVSKQVEVLSQKALQAAGISRTSELYNVVPTLTAVDPTRTSFAPGIRGIAPISDSVGVQSQTGVVVDDFPQSTFSGMFTELADIDRVEVFAGPQATLSGRNSAGGLINFVTRTPSMTPHYEMNLEQTTDTGSKVSVFATAPLTSNLAYSLSMVFDKWDGNLKNYFQDNDRVRGYNTKAIRGKIRWTPTDRLTTTLTGYYFSTNRTEDAFISGGATVAGDPNAVFLFDALARPISATIPGYKATKYNRTIYDTENPTFNLRDRGVTFRADYDLSKLGTLSSLTQYAYSNQPRHDNFLGWPRDNLIFPDVTNFDAIDDIKSKFFTQEFRLSSPSTGPLTYTIGAIYTDTHIKQPYNRPELFTADWYRTMFIGSAALYGRATYNFTPKDSLTVGGRYQHDKLGYTFLFEDAPSTDPHRFAKGSNNYGFFGGEVSYKHNFTDHINAYATVSESQTGRAYDLEDSGQVSTTGGLKPLNSEHARNYEIGIKSQLFDRRLTLNVDAYWTDYKNYQIQSTVLGTIDTAPTTKLLAVGKVRSRGIDLNAALRATNNLRLSFDGAYQEPKIRSFPGAACYTGQTAAQGCDVANNVQGNLHGLMLPYASKWKFSTSADYSLPVNERADINAGIFYRYQSSQHFDVLGDPVTYQHGFGTMNLYAGPADHDGKWSVQLFVNNVFNKHYYALLSHSSLYTLTSPSGVVTMPIVTAEYDRNAWRYAGIRASFKM